MPELILQEQYLKMEQILKGIFVYSCGLPSGNDIKNRV
jgi:hypothetical protein